MGTISIRHALRRSVFHATIGIMTGIALLVFPRLAVLLVLAVVSAMFLSLDIARLFMPGFNRFFSVRFSPLLREGERIKLTGSSYFLVGCLITVLAVPPDIASLAILFLSLGDPAATLVGIWKGRTSLWGKSIEGNAACLVVCSLIGTLFVVITEHPALVIAIIGAIAASIFQALPLRLNDNITIPLGSAVVMWAISMLV